MKRRVVISGMGVVTSLSRRVEDLFDRLCRGESGIRGLQRIDVARLPVKFGGEVPHWSGDGHIAPKEAMSNSFGFGGHNTSLIVGRMRA
jgi:3-oxoacyl-[acyl-carrier-protein] synthase II